MDRSVLLRSMLQAVQQRHFRQAYEAAEALAGQGWRAEIAPLALSLIAAEVVSQEAAGRADLARERLQRFHRHFGSQLADSQVLTGDILMAAGLRQEASEYCRRLYEHDRRRTDAAHRIGLCELSRAMTSNLRNANAVTDRWRHALAYLSTAAWDARYVGSWMTARLEAYGVAWRDEITAGARKSVFDRLQSLLTDQAEAADFGRHTKTSASLRGISAQFRIDEAGTEVMQAALRAVNFKNSATAIFQRPKVPLPFGMLWHQVVADKEAEKLLGELIRETEHLPLAQSGDTTDLSAPTHAAAVRQWYSRLAGIRYALRWGKFEEGQAQLENLCGVGESCQINSHPVFPRVSVSPRCCDPGCGAFAVCNPGYAGLARPAEAMELDAHRLGMRVCLGLALQSAGKGRAGYVEAAHHWVRGRMLARAINAFKEYDEQVAAQVMVLLESLRDDTEGGAELLDRALAAAPDSSLKGRFADLLTDRGIQRCNENDWERGAHDLRWALRLNSYSDRALLNLGLALQNLALFYLDRRNTTSASQVAVELRDLAARSLAEGRQEGTFGQLLQWAEEKIGVWRTLADSSNEKFVQMLFDNILGKEPPAESRRNA